MHSPRGEVLKPFTVSAEAALPADVCSGDASRPGGGGSTMLLGRSVARAPTYSFRDALDRRNATLRQQADTVVAAMAGAGAGYSDAGALVRSGGDGALAPSSSSRGGATAGRTLDGFMMLEACAVDLPEEAKEAVVESRGIVSLALPDLLYFEHLQVLNLGDNQLGASGAGDLMSCLGTCLPSLVELRLHCNGVFRIDEIVPASVDGLPTRGSRPVFPRLEVLDMSYNALTPDCVANLADLPVLRELDLTCNALTHVPDMSRFRRLEVLVVQQNKLADDMNLVNLSHAPRLRELNLASNYLHRIPKDCVADRSCFAYLEWLSLANNFFSSENDLLFLVKMQNLRQAVMFGNPVTFRKKPGQAVGEPTVPALSSDGSQEVTLTALEEERVMGKVVNLVTDDPTANGRAKPTLKGTYSNFRVTKVVEKQLPSNAEWREAGNRFLFEGEGADEDVHQLEDGEANGALPVGHTAAGSAQRARISSLPLSRTRGFGLDASEEEGEDGGSFFLTEADVDGIAEKTGLAPRIPTAFLNTGPSTSADDAANPVELRAALTALRHALKHPLTDDTSAPAPHYLSTTASMKTRKVPMRAYEPKGASGKSAGAASAPVSATAHHVRGVPGMEHTDARPMAGTSKLGPRHSDSAASPSSRMAQQARSKAFRAAGAGIATTGRPSSSSALGEPAGEKLSSQASYRRVLVATEEAKASVEAMEAMLQKVTHRTRAAGAVARGEPGVYDSTMQKYLSSMDSALKRYV